MILKHLSPFIISSWLPTSSIHPIPSREICLYLILEVIQKFYLLHAIDNLN